MTATCPTALERSMYADAELAPEAAAALERHLESCAACRARVAALRAERAAIRASLAAEIPAFAPTSSLGAGAATAGIAVLLAAGFYASSFWTGLGAAVPVPLRWLSPLSSGSISDFLVASILFLSREGTSMLTSIVQFAAAGVLVALALYVSVAFSSLRRATPLLFTVLLAAAALPEPGHALEIRKGEGLVTVAAGETVDDTVLAAGQTVSIDGDVNGDLLAFGRQVTVRGNVSGDLITAAETVDIQGRVRGNVFGAGRSVTLSANVDRNLYAAGRDLSIASSAEIAGNATTAGQNVNVDGRVGTDLTSAAEQLVIRGNVRRNVTAAGQSVALLAPANVGGNLTARVGDLEKVEIAPGATVGGTVDRQVVEAMRERAAPENRYLQPSFYVWQIVRLGAAFITGLLLLWVFPGLQTADLRDGMAILRAGAFGLVTAVALPVIALIACLTIVGLPLGLIGFVLWMLGLYFAKTVVAQVIGRRLFRAPHGPPHYAATLLAGLVIVLIAVNLPWIGWLVGIVLTCVGLGMLVAYVAERAGRTTA